MDQVKQVIIVRKDLKMGPGKMAAQVAHASVMSFIEADKMNEEVVKEWLKMGQKKIVVQVDDEESLIKLYKAFQYKKLPCAIVNDAGLTQLPPGTTTTLGVGPALNTDLDPITSKLKLL